MGPENQSQGALEKIAAITVLLFVGAAVLSWFNVIPGYNIASRDGEIIANEPADQLAEPIEAETPDVASQIAVPSPEPVEQAAVTVDVDVEDASQDTAPVTEDLAETQETPEQDLPEIGLDVIRISPDGSALVAGFAPSQEDVLILVDGSEIARTVADRQGKFVALFDIPQSDQHRSLTLGTEGAGGDLIEATAKALIAPTTAPEPEPAPEIEVAAAQVEDETESNVAVETAGTDLSSPAFGADNSGLSTVLGIDPADDRPSQLSGLEMTPGSGLLPDADGVTQSALAASQAVPLEALENPVAARAIVQDEGPDALDAPALSDAPQLVTTKDAQQTQTAAVAPTVIIADDQGITVLQPPPRPAAPGQAVEENVVIDTIEYDTSGDVALTGRGTLESSIQVYLDDKPVQTTAIRRDGTWAAPLPGIDAGIYQLRIDELDKDGNVTSRIETPFQREQLELAVDASGAITVQTGFTLWAIAEANFGDGAKYVRVYEANRDLIRDPDLIYPGQVFQVPVDMEDG